MAVQSIVQIKIYLEHIKWFIEFLKKIKINKSTEINRGGVPTVLLDGNGIFIIVFLTIVLLYSTCSKGIKIKMKISPLPRGIQCHVSL